MTTEIVGSDIIAAPDERPATAQDPLFAQADQPAVITSLDVVIPVYNEQNDLAQAVRRLHTYLSTSLPYSFRITIANNASTDRTGRDRRRTRRPLRRGRRPASDAKGAAAGR